MAIDKKLLKEFEGKGDPKHDIFIKKKYGRSDENNLGDLINGASFETSDENQGSKLLHMGSSYLEAGEYVVEWLLETKDENTEVTGKLRHNKKEKHRSKAKKKKTMLEFKGSERITFSTSGKQDIEIDLEKIGKKKASVIRSSINLYKI